MIINIPLYIFFRKRLGKETRMVLKWFSITGAFPFEVQVFFFPIHNSLNSKGEMIGNVLTGSFQKKVGIHA